MKTTLKKIKCTNCNKKQCAKRINSFFKNGFDLQHIDCADCGQHTLTAIKCTSDGFNKIEDQI